MLLASCGVSIDIEVDKYCLLLNLARVRAHAQEGGQSRTIDPALGSIEMEPVAEAPHRRLFQRSVS